MPKILNYGSLNLDYVYSVDHFVQPGETLAADSRSIFAGGKGLNQSVALARAGGEVYHAGAVGRSDSQVLQEVIAAAGIRADFLQQRDGPSGHTIIQVDKNGQNCILLFGGANQSITREEIDHTLSFFAPGDYLILQNEINEIAYLISEGARRGLKVCFNVSPFTPALLQLPLSSCHLLVVNEIEGAAMVDKSPEDDPYELIKALTARFPDTSLVLTLGVRGSILKENGLPPVSCRSFKVKAVDTTAAGDTFLGFLISSLSRGLDGAAALQTAAAASALAVTRPGACPSIPALKEVEQFLQETDQQVLTDRL